MYCLISFLLHAPAATHKQCGFSGGFFPFLFVSGFRDLWRGGVRVAIDVAAIGATCRQLIFQQTPSMFASVLLAAVVAVAYAADDKGDVGTVIGIDLGTTYSWFVWRQALLHDAVTDLRLAVAALECSRTDASRSSRTTKETASRRRMWRLRRRAIA